MAAGTLGTNATTSLVAIRTGPYGVLGGTQTPVNMAIINNHIKDDLTNGNPVIPGSFFGGPSGGSPISQQSSMDGSGLLYIPNRGVLKVLAGDVVAYDNTTGWPILVSANSIKNGPWNFVL